MVRLAGLEPARALAHHPPQDGVSAIPPQPHGIQIGASGQNRTVDTRIFSPLLPTELPRHDFL